MAKITVPAYSTAAVSAILAAIAANGNVANLEVATSLVDSEDGTRMGHPDVRLDNDGNPRKARSITAKMSRLAEVEGFTYQRKVATTKDGKPVTKKLDLVAKIADLSGIAAAKLDGLDKAPKLALETIAAAFAEAA